MKCVCSLYNFIKHFEFITHFKHYHIEYRINELSHCIFLQYHTALMCMIYVYNYNVYSIIVHTMWHLEIPSSIESWPFHPLFIGHHPTPSIIIDLSGVPKLHPVKSKPSKQHCMVPNSIESIHKDCLLHSYSCLNKSQLS